MYVRSRFCIKCLYAVAFGVRNTLQEKGELSIHLGTDIDLGIPQHC